MEFKDFLLSENESYLGQQIADVVSALSDLNTHGPNMGTRPTVEAAETIVGKIRRILHTHWPKEETKYLAALQKVGVSIMRAVEEKDDLLGVLQSSEQELSKTTSDMGVPVNSLASPETSSSETQNVGK